MQPLKCLVFQIPSKKKKKKTNLIVSKICVCQKRDNMFIYIYLFNLQGNIERHYTRSNYLAIILSVFKDVKILVLS